MRAKVDQKALAAAVKEARAFVPAVPDTPASGAISLSCGGGMLTLTGQGPRGQSSAALPVEPDFESGDVLVPPKPLEQLVRALPRGPVSLSIDDHGDLEVVGGDASQGYRLRSVPGSHAPLPFRFDAELNVDPAEIVRASAAVRRSAGGEENSALLRVDGSRLIIEATDNYRLSRAEIDVEAGASVSAVLRHADLEAAAKAGCSRIAFDSGSAAVRFSGENQSRVVRALDRPFPPTDGLVRRPAPHLVEVEAEALAAALRRLEAVTQGGPATLLLGTGSLLLSGENSDVGSGAESIPAQGGGEDVNLLVRSEYLLDVAEIEAGTLRICYSDAASALRFEGQGGTVHVVMPLRRA